MKTGMMTPQIPPNPVKAQITRQTAPTAATTVATRRSPGREYRLTSSRLTALIAATPTMLTPKRKP